MFDRIAPRYDLLNSVLSFGLDARWRKAAAHAAGLHPRDSALDVCCGSGKLTEELTQAAPRGRVVGLDFSEAMLEIARRTAPLATFVAGDALALPFQDSEFEAATMAFGLRNLADPSKGLREMARVARRLVVLEFLRPPDTAFGALYRFHLGRLLPRLGGAVSGSPEAYRYLSDTVGSYLTGKELVDLAHHSGWRVVHFRSLTLGTVGLLTGHG